MASIIAISVWGLKFGIDFTGGSLLEIEYVDKRPSVEEIKQALGQLGLGNVVIQPTGDKGVILRFKDIDENKHQEVLKSLGIEVQDSKTIIEKRFDSIGPTIGHELKKKAIYALILAIFAIVAYIAWAFRHVSKPVSSWKYGTVAVLALAHDAILPTGIFSALGKFYNVEIDILFITALLTIMGFSVHDTIVVFDRIRENLRKLKKSEDYSITVNRSINETIVRSINTSLTTLIVLAAIFWLGGESTKNLALALILGITFGTYSSIFVASPLLVVWSKFRTKK